MSPAPDLRRQLEADGVRLIGLRNWAIVSLFRLALRIDPDIFLALCRFMARKDYDDELPRVK